MWSASEMTDVRLTRDLVTDGFTAAELARSIRSGELLHLRRGVYLPKLGTPPSSEEVHRELVHATMRLASPGSVVSHSSAAILHRLPVLEVPTTVSVTRPRAGGRKRSMLHLYVAGLDASEVIELDGLSVTSRARTVVDVGRSQSFGRSVVVGDAALRAGLTRADLAMSVEGASGRPGVGAARRMAGFVDARSESPGESLSRVVFHGQGLTTPVLQYEVFDHENLVGRSDFCWPEERTLGEFDGKIKYGRLLRTGETIQDVVYREKLREDALRDLGWQVVRWTWSDLQQPRALSSRLLRAFHRTTLI